MLRIEPEDMMDVLKTRVCTIMMRKYISLPGMCLPYGGCMMYYQMPGPGILRGWINKDIIMKIKITVCVVLCAILGCAERNEEPFHKYYFDNRTEQVLYFSGVTYDGEGAQSLNPGKGVEATVYQPGWFYSDPDETIFDAFVQFSLYHHNVTNHPSWLQGTKNGFTDGDHPEYNADEIRAYKYYEFILSDDPEERLALENPAPDERPFYIVKEENLIVITHTMENYPPGK
jgi:hypothetical protein